MASRHLARLAVVALIACVAGAALACGSSSDKKEPGFSDDPTPIPGVSTPVKFPLEVKRSDGKTLTLEKPASHIVSLSPGATEIIFALGAESTLAAVDNQATYPDGAKNFPTKVDAYQPNIESIIALKPDLAIVASNTGGIVEALDRAGIPVLFMDIDTDVKTVDAIFGQIGLIGRITGTEGKSLELIASLTARVKAVEAKMVGLPNTKGPRVYHELDNTYYSVSEDTFIGDIYRILRARNIAGDGGGIPYPQLTQEAIISADPEVIVLADEAFGVSIASVQARPGWGAIKAVQDGRIFAVDPDIVSRPGPRVVDALEQLAADFYPQTFGAGAGTPSASGTTAAVTPTPVGTAVGTAVAATPAP